MIGAVCFLVACQLVAAGAGTNAEFDQANKLYEEGHYTKAAAGYEKLVQQGIVSPTLWFNLGNARFKAGEFGKAVAAYRHAETLSPRDPDVRFNLRFVRQEALGSEAPTRPWLERTLRLLTLNEWTLLVCLPFWGAFVLLAVRQWKPAWRRRARGWLALFAGLTVLFGLALAGAVRLHYFEKAGVIVVAKAEVRPGPLEVSKPAFTAKDGTEVRILDQLNGWWQIEDLTGRVGWVQQKDVMLLDAG